MLLDDTLTVDANDLPVREGLTDQSQGLCIEVWLVVGNAFVGRRLR